MQHGSLINSVSGSVSNPAVGMGATILMWSDRKAATIISVSASGKSVTVQTDKATRTDNLGMSDSQSYEFTPDENGSVYVFSHRNNGQWVLKGDSATSGMRLGIGYRSHYHDYSF